VEVDHDGEAHQDEAEEDDVVGVEIGGRCPWRVEKHRLNGVMAVSSLNRPAKYVVKLLF
jgi:hypothetical protein